MMVKPGITELDRCVDSRYTLVSVVAKRARMIGEERNNSDGPYDKTLDKPVTQAVNELSQGVVGYVRSEAIQKARAYEEEKLEALSLFNETKSIAAEEEDAIGEDVAIDEEAAAEDAPADDDELLNDTDF